MPDEAQAPAVAEPDVPVADGSQADSAVEACLGQVCSSHAPAAEADLGQACSSDAPAVADDWRAAQGCDGPAPQHSDGPAA